jgi:beta-ribofuranosylaminobenzene 5'-phosphate synthase
MGRGTPRACGGIGFAIQANPVRWSLEKSPVDALTGIDRLDASAKAQIASAIRELRRQTDIPATSISLLSHPDQHSGFGTKTALLTSLIEGLNLLHDLQFDPDQVRRITGRGGTSGIGIHTAFTGGLVWDGGHQQGDYPRFAPSGQLTPICLPPLIGRWDFPDAFRVVLFNSTAPGRLGGTEEAEFFERVCPVSKAETLAAFGGVFHGFIPGVVTRDIDLLREGLIEIHRTGFKRYELEIQESNVRDLYQKLASRKRVGVGLSSLGPLIYAIVLETDVETMRWIEASRQEGQLPPFEITSGRNYGFAILQ